MLTPPRQVYPNNAKAIWMVYDLRYPEACQLLHEQRAAWQEHSDIEALDEDHFVLVIQLGAVVGKAV